jgi:hypothetical protein
MGHSEQQGLQQQQQHQVRASFPVWCIASLNLEIKASSMRVVLCLPDNPDVSCRCSIIQTRELQTLLLCSDGTSIARYSQQQWCTPHPALV